MNIIFFEKIIFYFFIYSFFGWLGESIYKSIKYQTLINTGFLKGPVTPIFGIGALLMLILEYYFKSFIPEFFRILLYTGMAVILEYITSVFFEKIYKKKLWDYSNKFLNIKGRICFQFTIYWFLLSLMVIKIIHPVIQSITSYIFKEIKLIDLILVLLLLLDIIYSFRIYKFLRKIIKQSFSNIKNEVQPVYVKISNKYSNLSRPSLPFKFVNNYQAISANRILNKNITIVDKDFYELTKDITEHIKFNELKLHKHHDSTIYDHAIKISLLSYKICKRINLDYKSAARGGLLHDFFFYNWRKEKPIINNKKRLHAFYHPQLALKNAEKYFYLNKIEKDIIIKHMWPLTIIPPKYPESFVVSLIDKIISTKEFLIDFL